MSKVLSSLIPIIVIYLSLILHEIGHCLFPRLVGFNFFNGISIGTGNRLISFNLLGIQFRFNVIPIPYGRYFTTKGFNDVEFYRRVMNSQTKAQIFMTHFGGNLMNLLLWGLAWMIMSFINIDSIANGLLLPLVRWTTTINGYIFVGNLIPMNIHHDIEEFAGNDIVQLIRRLKLHSKQVDRSM